MKKYLSLLLALLLGAVVQAQSYTVTVSNPQGGYVYYGIHHQDGSDSEYGRVLKTTEVFEVADGDEFCVDFGSIDPTKQSLYVDAGHEVLESVWLNGEGLELSEEVFSISDQWESYGYKLYTICLTVEGEVTYEPSFSAYTYDSAYVASATLTVVNHGNGYLAQMVNGAQQRVYNTRYFALEAGVEKTFVMGSFAPTSPYYGSAAPDSASRLTSVTMDGAELSLDESTAGLTFFNWADQGYAWYNYLYTQDSGVHTLEFFFEPYADSGACEPIATPKLTEVGGDFVQVSWMPSPSEDGGGYTLLLYDGGDSLMDAYTVYGTSTTVEGLEYFTDYGFEVACGCLNGGTAKSERVHFRTKGAPATFYIASEGGYLYCFNDNTRYHKTYGTVAMSGYEGDTLHFWAESESAEYAAMIGTPQGARLVHSIVLDTEELVLDGSDERVSVQDNWESEGFIGYEVRIPFGGDHFVTFNYTTDCETPEITGVQYTSDGATLAWSGNAEGYVVKSAMGDGNTTEGGYRLEGLEAGEEYAVSIGALCLHQDTVWSEPYMLSLPGEKSVTVTNHGGGHLYSYEMDAVVTDGESVTLTGMTGDETVLQLASFTAEVCGNFGVSEEARTVTGVSFDGVSVPLDGSDVRVAYADYTSDYGYIIYNVYIPFGEVDAVDVYYGDRMRDTVNCTALANIMVEPTPQDVHFTWQLEACSNDTVTIYFGGEEVTTTGSWRDWYGLDEDTEYTVTFVNHCLNGNSADTTFTFRTRKWASFTVNNPDGGHLYMKNYGFTTEQGPITIDGYEGDMTSVQLMSYTFDAAVDNGVSPSARELVSVTVDGSELPLTDSTEGLYIYDYSESDGIIYYVYQFAFGDVSTIELAYTGEELDTVNCEPIDALYVEWADYNDATIRWQGSMSADGAYELFVTGVDNDYAYSSGLLSAVGYKGNYYVDGLGEGMTYAATLVAHCLNGEADTQTVTFSTLGRPLLTLTNEGGGAMYITNWGYTVPEGTASIVANEGDSYCVAFTSYTEEGAKSNWVSGTKRLVESASLDGEVLNLDDYIMYDYWDYGYITYRVCVDMDGDHELVVSFTGDAPDTVNCTPVEEGRAYCWSPDRAELHWDAPLSNDGRFVVSCNGKTDTTTSWAYTLDNLEENTTYTATVTSLCLNGSSADTTITFTTPAWRYIHITKVGKGNRIMATGENNDETITTPGTYTYRGTLGGDMKVLFFSYSAAQAESEQVSKRFREVEYVIYDGDTLSLENQPMLQVVDWNDGGTVEYVLYPKFDTVDHYATIVFSGDDIPAYDVVFNNHGYGPMHYIVGETYHQVTDTATYEADSATSLTVQLTTYNPYNGAVSWPYDGNILVALLVDGDTVALDGTDDRVNIWNNTSTEVIVYQLGLTVDGPHTIDAYYEPWPKPTLRTVTLLNPDGGYMEYSLDGEYAGTVEDSLTLTLNDGAAVCVAVTTDSPLSQYYEFPDATQLESLYFDGSEIAIDGSDPDLVIYDLMATDNFILYRYCFAADTDHVVEAAFGPWTGDIDTTPTATYTMTFTNSGNGYMIDNNDDLVVGTQTVTVDSGEYFYTLMASVSPKCQLGQAMGNYGLTGYKLQMITVDGEEVPLVESNELEIETLGDSIIAYYLTLTADTAHSIVGTFGAWDEGDTVVVDSTFRTVTLLNPDGGYMEYSLDGEYAGMVEDSLTLILNDGTEVCVAVTTDSPLSQYYEFPDATQLESLYFDGSEIAIDGSDPDLVIYDLMATNNYILYQYCFAADTDHVFEAAFGPWTGEIDTTPTATFTVTFTNNGSGYMAQGDNLIVGTQTATADSGTSFYTTFASIHPDSKLGQAMGDYGFTGYKLLKILVDDEEVPLEESDMLEIDNLMSTDSLIAYYLYTTLDADHTIEGVFGAWDEGDTINPQPDTTYTFTLTNTGNGLMLYEIDDMEDLNFVNGTTTVSVAGGEDLYVEFIDIQNTDDPEVQLALDEFGLTQSHLSAIKLDGNNVPLVSGGNLMIINSNTYPDAEIPDGVTIYALLMPADGPHTIEGIFSTDTTVVEDTVYTVTTTVAEAGTGTVTGGGTYPAGTVVTLTATAAEGYAFAYWQDGNSDNPRTFVLNADIAFEATFLADSIGIDDVDALQAITLYPNPALTTVTLDGLGHGATLTVVDQQGRTLTTATATAATVTLDVSTWPRGTYFVRISQGTANAVRKLLVR